MKINRNIEFSFVDSRLKLSYIKICELVEDSVTQYLHENNMDNPIIKDKYDALNVVYKHHVHIDKLPVLGDNISITSGFGKIRNASFIIDVKAENYFECSSFICLMNNTTRYPESLKNINFCGKTVYAESLDFSKIVCNNLEYVYSVDVLSCDIDYSNHANNKSYIRYIFNAMKTREINSYDISDFEINYLKEAKEGDKLDIYRENKDNEILFQIRRGTDIVTQAKIVIR